MVSFCILFLTGAGLALFFSSICSILLAVSVMLYQLCCLHMLHYPVMYSLSERVTVKMQRTGNTVARLKIVPPSRT